MHAIIPMVGDIKIFANVDFLVPLSYHPLMAPIKKTLLFIKSRTPDEVLVTKILKGMAKTKTCSLEGCNLPMFRLKPTKRGGSAKLCVDRKGKTN
jgi:hypothetical protein